ncbi:MAG TPA: M20 family metallopeptidase [Acidimicrobiia bacterium]
MSTSARDTATAAVDAHHDALVDLSHRIHAHPELKFEEERSSAWTAEALADRGFSVEQGVCDLPTAFIARAGNGPLHIALCAEYDALPGVGHACGHNIIAASAVGAGLALAPIADDLGITVSVIGTPAEEGGGGKIFLLERGAFDGVHAALMVHPAPIDGLRPRVSAVAHFEVRATGRASHAAAAPELGINAADALTVAQVAIGLLRQHIRATDQVHGIVLDGGDAANIVPAHACADYMVRATTVEQLAELRPRIERCFDAGALATGAHIEIHDECPTYTHMQHDDELVELYREGSESLGREYSDLEMTFSTDMGNVSLALPSIHPCIGIDTAGAVNHQPEFAAACVNASADQAVRDSALGMALAVIAAASSNAARDRLLARGGYAAPMAT